MVKRFLHSEKVAPYVFVFPFVIIFLVFWFYPLCNSFVMSFQERMLGQAPKWVQFSNYSKLLGDKVFLKAVSNSFIYTVWTLILLIPFPMIFAVLIDNKVMLAETLSLHFSSSTYFSYCCRNHISTYLERWKSIIK